MRSLQSRNRMSASLSIYERIPGHPFLLFLSPIVFRSFASFCFCLSLSVYLTQRRRPISYPPRFCFCFGPRRRRKSTNKHVPVRRMKKNLLAILPPWWVAEKKRVSRSPDGIREGSTENIPFLHFFLQFKRQRPRLIRSAKRVGETAELDNK